MTQLSHRIGVFSVLALVAGCSAAGDGSGSGAQNVAETGGAMNSSGGSSAVIPGCTTAPACGTCSTCAESCYCTTQNIAYCATACASSGGTSSGTFGSGGVSAVGGASDGVGGSPIATGDSTNSANGGSTAVSAGGDDGASAGGAPGSGGAMSAGGTTGVANTQSFDLVSANFPVAAGAEVYECQNFKNPVGSDFAIVQSESFMSPGSHHMFVFHGPSGTGQIEDQNDPGVSTCSGVEFDSDFIHAAQTPQQTATYPSGVGRLVKGTDGLRILVHYLNTTSSALTGSVDVKFQYVQPNQVQYLANEVFLNQLVTVPPGTSTQSDSYTTSWATNLLLATGHMHKHGTEFVAKTQTGQILYQTNDWDEPLATTFDPPIAIPSGTTITWSCTYDNQTGQTLTFGESAASNEMCIFVGTQYTTDASHQGQPMNTLTGLFGI